ncbi:ABC transporter substrate-binding protein [Acerihabitans arboris]|uniref:ABC transporter substrate-binding protein n=1 Tax=Acerihabitans arboris TaxID=2691583 RepID=A0A845SPC7_9GAMM|nr:ABC transporter substrate-binding protein [Acerihabitans arboris]NDL65222.1 ABC transporter substrate-binding protein [Acerihabitans arboris]
MSRTCLSALSVGILLLASSFLGASMAGEPTPVRGGTLIAAIYPEPVTLTATYNNQYANRVISANIFDGLVYYDDKFQPRPRLATSWEVAADGLSITFHLRKGVTWHDGVPFTSADVKYSALEVWKKVHSRGRSTFSALKDVETPDDDTAIFRLSSPSQVILSALDGAESQVVPKHIFDGGDIRKSPENARPIGTGPFRFKEWKRGQYVVLEKNPDYWDKGKPYLDRVIYRFIPDAAARSGALESGEVSYIPYAGVPFSDIARLKKNPELKFESRGYAYAAQTYFIGFNLRSPVLSNLNVRQAIAHIIDRQRLIDTVWYGQSKPEYSVVPESLTRFYTSDIPRYAYDVAKAGALLDEAGYPVKAGGKRFTLRLYTDPSSGQFLLAGEFLRQEFSKIGIDIAFSPLDNATFLKKVYSDYDYDIIFQGFGVMLDPQMGLTRVFDSKAQSPGVPYANAFAYSSPATDRLITAYQNEVDPQRRIDVFHQFQRQTLTDLPLLPVMEAPFFTVYNRKLQGLDFSPAGAHSGFRDAWIAAQP